MNPESQGLGADGVPAPRPRSIKRKYSKSTYRGRITLRALGVRWHRDYNDYCLMHGNRVLGRVIPGPCASVWIPVFYFGDLKKLPIFGKLLTRNALFSHGDYVNLTRAKDAIRIHAEALLRDAKSSKAARQ